MDDVLYPQPLDRLKDLGDPRDTRGWVDGEWNYVGELGLAAVHVPGLIRIGRQWLDWAAEEEELLLDKPEFWTPVHAWRALGQLQAVEAVQPLLDMMAGLDTFDDDWYMHEFPEVFALIGTPALEPMQRYLADPNHDVYPRAVVAHGLCRMAERLGDCRDRVVAMLAEVLADYQQHPPDLNAFIIGHLLSLKAVEHAEVIERAFAANQVDDEICGYWGKVRQELGIEGMGLAPDYPPPRPRINENYFRIDPPESSEKQEHIRQRKRQEKLKAKRKQRQKAQKKNRKKK